MEEILVARDSIIFLLQQRGFGINFKKFALEPTQEIEFLGMIVNSKTKTLSLPQEKVQKIKSQCLEVYRAQEITLLELTRLFRNINFHYSRYSPSTSSVSVSSTTTDSNAKEECILHGHSDIERYGQRGTCMVDKKFRIKQWSGHYSASLTDTNADRCFQEKVEVQCVKGYELGAYGQRRNRSII